MNRTVVIGDVHGCASELADLLARIGCGEHDRVFFVGDLVVRGPDPAGVMARIHELGAQSVKGNHEDRLLRWRRFAERTVAPRTQADERIAKSAWLRRAAEMLEPRDWDYLERLPLWLDVPEHGVRLVHAGLVPGVPIDEQSARVLMYTRTIDAEGRPSELRDGGTPWGALYEGPPHVVFGHNALHDPQLYPWATGIDTGCVYGGHLTALVLDAGARVPPVADRKRALVSVRARTAHFVP